MSWLVLNVHKFILLNGLEKILLVIQIHVLMAFSIIGASASFAASISAAIYAAINGGYQREIYYAGVRRLLFLLFKNQTII